MLPAANKAAIPDDPFSMFLATNPTSKPKQSVQPTTSPFEEEKESTTEVGGTGGGWGDEDDDLDIDD